MQQATSLKDLNLPTKQVYQQQASVQQYNPGQQQAMYQIHPSPQPQIQNNAPPPQQRKRSKQMQMDVDESDDEEAIAQAAANQQRMFQDLLVVPVIEETRRLHETYYNNTAELLSKMSDNLMSQNSTLKEDVKMIKNISMLLFVLFILFFSGLVFYLYNKFKLLDSIKTIEPSFGAKVSALKTLHND